MQYNANTTWSTASNSCMCSSCLRCSPTSDASPVACVPCLAIVASPASAALRTNPRRYLPTPGFEMCHRIEMCRPTLREDKSTSKGCGHHATGMFALCLDTATRVH